MQSEGQTVPIKIRPESEYDPIEYAMGVKIEMEHTADPKRLSRIVREHLEEIPDYYTRLVKMEQRAERGLAPNPPIHEEVYRQAGKWAVYEMEGPAGYRYPKRAITPKFSSQRDLRLSPEYRVWCEQNGLTHELKLIEAMRKRRQSLED